MLASVGSAIPTSEEWVHQVKWDGIRILADVSRSGVKLTSRQASDFTARYPGLASYKGRDLLVDGEAVVLNSDGLPDPVALRRKGAEPILMVFDILRLDGKDVTRTPWEERQAMIEDLGLRGRWQPVPCFDDGQALFDATRAMGLEGVVSKKRTSTYQAGVRSQEWLKFKHYGS